MAFKISDSIIINDSRNLVRFAEGLNSLGNTGASPNIDISSGNFVAATLNQNATFTFSNPPTGACSFTLFLSNDATPSRSITWPVSVQWPNAQIPNRTTTASKTDVYTFFTLNGGTNWYGILSIYNYS
jgi:hypothetical protein